MTEEQKFIFDLKGYLLLPEVLTASEVDEIKSQIDTIRSDPDSLPEHERRFPGGASSLLIDHPVIVDILQEILGEIRMESSWFTYRNQGDGGPAPHGGVRNVNPNFSYQCTNGKIYSALTRVVFELNEVKAGEGGTLFCLVVIKPTSRFQMNIVLQNQNFLRPIVVLQVLQLSLLRIYVILEIPGKILTDQGLLYLTVITLLDVNFTNLLFQSRLLMVYPLKNKLTFVQFGFGVKVDLIMEEIFIMMVNI